MCGIVGGVIQQDILPVLMDGLHRLEYRGYDSAGVAVTNGKRMQCLRVAGKVAELKKSLAENTTAFRGGTGLAHTRWATHGRPVLANAHPLTCKDTLALVHNGIIENHESLRNGLQAKGYKFQSETDSEVVLALVYFYLKDHPKAGLLAAVQSTIALLQGSYAIVIMNKKEPDQLVAARCGSPLIIGIGNQGHYVASDIFCLLPVAQQFILLEEGDVTQINSNRCTIYDNSGQPVTRECIQSEEKAETANKGDYRHYMLKEIYEQPVVLRAMLDRCMLNGVVVADSFGEGIEEIFSRVKNVIVIACGTSYHAALTFRCWLHRMTTIFCSVEVASEFRYADLVVPEDCLLIAVSQSGETADTLAAMRRAKEYDFIATLAICNMAESSLAREADLVFLTKAGIEIGVASTKTFTAQLMALFFLNLALAERHSSNLTKKELQKLVQALLVLPDQIESLLERYKSIQPIAEHLDQVENVLYLGRNILLPVAMEGALKLKEISYIHAEAYAAGELKHGPLALIDEDMLIVALVADNPLKEKMLPNLDEVKARGGKVCLFSDETVQIETNTWVSIFQLPAGHPLLAPFLHTIPLQLLAYCTAVLRGSDVDQPRNLAKSVTVE